MEKTNIPNVYRTADGVLVTIVENDDYEQRRAKAIAEKQQKEKINMLEDRVSNMEDMLRQILEKVSNG